jgi:hypothetical protein
VKTQVQQNQLGLRLGAGGEVVSKVSFGGEGGNIRAQVDLR